MMNNTTNSTRGYEALVILKAAGTEQDVHIFLTEMHVAHGHANGDELGLAGVIRDGRSCSGTRRYGRLRLRQLGQDLAGDLCDERPGVIHGRNRLSQPREPFVTDFAATAGNAFGRITTSGTGHGSSG